MSANNPTVACVMLASGRPEMVRRAIKSFHAQTYEDKWLHIMDTGNKRIYEPADVAGLGERVTYRPVYMKDPLPIGTLRNHANDYAKREDKDKCHSCDAELPKEIFCHWDSDDWSHPNRIADQVALLQSSGAECVGYDEMLFWRLAPCGRWDCEGSGCCRGCEAWLYRAAGCMHIKNYAIGTSMCYWRETWEKFPFPDYSAGCDDLRWAQGDSKTGTRAVKIVSFSSIEPIDAYSGSVPRMIASIHGGNTCANFVPGAKEWTRVPEWDAYCREAMKL